MDDTSKLLSVSASDVIIDGIWFDSFYANSDELIFIYIESMFDYTASLIPFISQIILTHIAFTQTLI